MKARVIRYLSAAVFCALLVWLYVSGRDPWTLPLVEQYRIWCDAFTVPGLLLVLAGSPTRERWTEFPMRFGDFSESLYRAPGFARIWRVIMTISGGKRKSG